MKKIFVTLITLVVCLTAKSQYTYLFDTGSFVNGLQDTRPTRDIEITDDGIIVTYEFKGFNIQNDDLYSNRRIIKVDGFGLNSNAGEPSIPMRWDSFVVPDGKKAKVEVVDSVLSFMSFPLSPARPILSDDSDGGHTIETVTPIMNYQGYFPKYFISADGYDEYRGTRSINIRISPFKYNLRFVRLACLKQLSIKITWENDEEESNEACKMNIGKFDKYFSNQYIYQATDSSAYAPTLSMPISESYLIVTRNIFKTAAERFANWKRTLGHSTEILYCENMTSNDIGSFIKNYAQQHKDLYYLLIIGDADNVPSSSSEIYHGSSSEYEYYTDLRYVCLGGTSDYIADIYYGRLPVSTLSEANTVVDKIIRYEKYPVNDFDFYNTGLVCAQFQDDGKDGYEDRRFLRTAEDVKYYTEQHDKFINQVYFANNGVVPTNWENGYYAFGESLPDELLDSNFNWNGNSSDIINHIDNGCFIVLHRDHGHYTLWGSPRFTINNVGQLSNKFKLPVVFSINCLTGGYSLSTFLAKSFLTHSNGGSAAVYAASCVSLSGLNDALTLGMFDAIWPNPGLIVQFPYKTSNITPTPTPTYRLGQILQQGLKRMDETWHKNNYTREIFHIFGDPSMRLYTEMPRRFDNVSVIRTNNYIKATLKNNERAEISFYNKTTGDVQSCYGNTSYYYNVADCDVVVCVSGHNRIPFVDSMSDDIYLQDEMIDGIKSFRGNKIFIGTNVTNQKQSGNVIFDGIKTTLEGNQIEISGNTTIELGSELEIITK